MYLKFMLVRLIATRQVVLLCDNSNAYLFYSGQVYRHPMGNSVFWNLPTHKNIPYCPILTLIDVDYDNMGPPMSSSSNIWPIQASSPNRIQWRSWAKQNKAIVLGMPLWSIDELTEGYVCSPFLPSTPAMSVRDHSFVVVYILTANTTDFETNLRRSLIGRRTPPPMSILAGLTRLVRPASSGLTTFCWKFSGRRGKRGSRRSQRRMVTIWVMPSAHRPQIRTKTW